MTRQQATHPVFTATAVGSVAVGLATAGVQWLFVGSVTAVVAGSIAGTGVAVTLLVWWSHRLTKTAAGPQRLTLATWLTLARGWAVVVIAAVFAHSLTTTAEPASWLLAGLVGLAVVLDVVDGAVARRTATVSALGGRLDTEMDSLLVVVGTLGGVAANSVPVAFLAVGTARYGFVFGRWVRRYRGLAVTELESNPFRQLTGGTIMGIVLVAVWPPTSPTISWWVAAVLTGPILAHFLWDWLAVAGYRSTAAEG